MQALFLTAFIAGLLLNIYFVIRGAERWRGTDVARRLDAFGRELTLGSVSLRTPIVASSASTFGLMGYVLTRYAGLSLGYTIFIAALVAGVAVTSAILLVKKWAVPLAMKDVPDERYILQGQLARVTRTIPLGGTGEVEYIIDGQRFSIPAQSISDAPLDAGTDVVVERVEHGIVFVEEWALVEQRL